MEMVVVLVVAAILTALLTGSAEAQIAAVPITTAGDNTWQQLVNVIIENGIKPLLAALSVTIASLLTAALAKWLSRLGIDLSQAQKNELQDAAIKALQWAVMKAIPLIAQLGWAHPDVRKSVIFDAAQYMKEKFPDTVKRSAKQNDINEEQIDTALLQPILTRLVPQVFTEAAASPATPPSDKPVNGNGNHSVNITGESKR
jgi:hypothetical protein